MSWFIFLLGIFSFTGGIYIAAEKAARGKKLISVIYFFAGLIGIMLAILYSGEDLFG